MKNPNKSPRHIPSRYIHYSFVCRKCGKSDDGIFDKFKEPKKDDYLYCHECEDELIQEFGSDDYDLPF